MGKVRVKMFLKAAVKKNLRKGSVWSACYMGGPKFAVLYPLEDFLLVQLGFFFYYGVCDGRYLLT